MTIKIGMIGAGVISDAHLLTLETITEAEVAVIADVNEEALNRQAERYRIPKRTTDYRVILDDNQIDLVYVCVPHYLHNPITIAAFEAGKHVVCEKPLAINLAQADQMIHAAQQARKRLFVAESHRFLRVNFKIRELLNRRIIGRPFLCLATFIGDELERLNDLENWKGTLDMSGGGVIIDNGFHMIDALQTFFGEVENVFAAGERLVTDAENKEEDTALITLRFKNSVLAELSLTFAARYCGFPSNYQGVGLRFDIFGTEGSLHFTDADDNHLSLASKTGTKIIALKDGHTQLTGDVTLDMNRHFIDCIRNDSEPSIKPHEAREVMRTIDACYKSIKTGEKVNL